MPIYEYRCEDGHTFEVMQRITDDPVAKCEVCGKPVQRVFHPVAIHFKGKGFYNTDYGTKKRQRETAAAGEGKKDSSGSGSSSSSSSDASSNGTAPKKPEASKPKAKAAE